MAVRADTRPRRSALGDRVAAARRGRGSERPKRPKGPMAPVAPPGYLLLLGVVVVLEVIGLVMVLSASSVQALRAYGSSWLFFKRQVMWIGLGSLALVVTARVDYRHWRRARALLLLASTALLAAVLVPGFGVSVNGSARWLGVGSWRVQPSELAKLAVLVHGAYLLADRADAVRDARRTTRPVVLVLAALVVMVMLQPDMGTTLVLSGIVLALLFVAGTPLVTMARLVFAAIGVALVAGAMAPYRRARLLSFLDPWKDKSNTGYQSVQALVGLGSGRLAGVGLGASRAKWGFLPNAHTDFIFAIIGEELGLIGSLLVVGLFVAFAALGVRAAARAPDRFGSLLAAGVTAWVVGQAFLNIGAVIGILPITGVPLPFVSFGGSSLVLLMVGVGILLNVARQGR